MITRIIETQVEKLLAATMDPIDTENTIVALKLGAIGAVVTDTEAIRYDAGEDIFTVRSF